MAKKRTKKIKVIIPDDLLRRAEKIGMSPEQIATYTDPAALLMACNAIRPQATAHPAVEKKTIVKPKLVGKTVTDSFYSVITEARSRYTSRVNYDEGQISTFMHSNKINPNTVKSILINRAMQPNDLRELVTEICIEYVK